MNLLRPIVPESRIGDALKKPCDEGEGVVWHVRGLLQRLVQDFLVHALPIRVVERGEAVDHLIDESAE